MQMNMTQLHRLHDSMFSGLRSEQNLYTLAMVATGRHQCFVAAKNAHLPTAFPNGAGGEAGNRQNSFEARPARLSPTPPLAPTPAHFSPTPHGML